PFFTPASTDELISMLKDQIGWRRLLAQRLLVESRQTDQAAKIRDLLPSRVPISPLNDGSPDMLHALWTLDGLGQLEPSDLNRLPAALTNPWGVSFIRDCIRLANLRFPGDESLQSATSRLSSHENGEVQLQVILTTRWSKLPDWAKMSVPVNLDDSWIQRAWLIAAPNISADVADAVVRESQQDPSKASTRSGFLRQLALNVAVTGDPDQLRKLAAVVGKSEESGQWWQTALVAGLADGLPQCQNTSLPRNLASLLQTPPGDLKEGLAPIARVLQRASKVAIDQAQNDVDRVAAMALMSHLPPETLATIFEQILSQGQSSACQQAAIEAVRRSNRADMAMLVLDHWEALNPQARSNALALLLLRRETTLDLLQKMTDGFITPSVVSIEQRLSLLQHPDAAIRSEAAGLFGGNVSANRKEVADQYSAALDHIGDPKSGATIFEKTCSKCHRINGVGHQVGPDISDTRARARDALLYDILDPNRRVDPQFTECVIATTDGQLMTGILIAESTESVVLRQPEGREQTVSRASIEELRSSQKSLMPEGIEKDVTVEQMADLLEFLKNH
ncbi:MAG: c-type cytochrome, partial [Planctomycetota bacterium]